MWQILQQFLKKKNNCPTLTLHYKVWMTHHPVTHTHPLCIVSVLPSACVWAPHTLSMPLDTRVSTSVTMCSVQVYISIISDLQWLSWCYSNRCSIWSAYYCSWACSYNNALPEHCILTIHPSMIIVIMVSKQMMKMKMMSCVGRKMARGGNCTFKFFYAD